MKNSKVVSINISKSKGVSKKPVKEATLKVNLGLEGDAHAGDGIRQVSLLAMESIKKQKECPKAKKADFSLKPGDFAENITTSGIESSEYTLGDKFRIGPQVIIEISKIGKECHRYCSIYYKIGDCIMPKEGIFAKVIKGGIIRTSDEIEKYNV